MIQIDTGIVAIFITILFALLGLAVGYGTLREKVKRNSLDVDRVREESKKEMEQFCSENREDHGKIYNKLDEINKYIRNGYSKGG